MAQKILLVNEWNTTQRYELTADEADQLYDAGAVFFCLGDTLKLEAGGSQPVGEPFIAFHPLFGGSGGFQLYVDSLEEYRAGPPGADDLDPFTGKLFKIIAKPKSGPEIN